jgi:hypothetical protein
MQLALEPSLGHRFVLQKAPFCKQSCKLLATPNNSGPVSLASSSPANAFCAKARAGIDAGSLL